MAKTITLAKVQHAIQQLRDNGEKVSRRNVLAVTGGGMSTVHRLMSEIEDLEALKAAKPNSDISPVLQKTIADEISKAVQKATTALQEQIRCFQDREQQALESLAELEIKAESLTAELAELVQKSNRERVDAESNQIKSKATIEVLEQALKDRELEKKELFSRLETAHINEAKTLLRLEQFEKMAEKTVPSLEK